MVWHKHAIRWAGWGSLALTLLVLGCVGGLLLWLANSYSRYHPLDLGPYLPRIEAAFAKRGVNLSIGGLELYYDGAPVVEAADVRVMGADNELSVLIENAAVKFANRRLFTFNLSPKIIEAKGVTLRLVRTTEGASIAGMQVMDMGDKKQPAHSGLVEWLNTLYNSPEFGRLKDVKVENLNLLLRDDVYRAEWVLEGARVAFSRYPDDGERGTLTARVRRLYGGQDGFSSFDHGTVMPVLVTFDHRAGAESATLSARFDQTDLAMVADYLPPKLKDMLRAQGSVELGTTLLTNNKFGKPWMTLWLNNAVMQFPQGYSKPLEFPKLNVTASYDPSPVDVLEIKNLTAVSKRGNVWQGEVKVTGLTTDPLIDARVRSEKGDIQGVFDFFPDQARGFDRALHWLRPNIRKANYVGLTGHYLGKPSAFPDCEERCGIFDIKAHVPSAEVKFLPEMTPVVGTSMTFVWEGTQMTVHAPTAKIGSQQANDVRVQITNMFSAEPSHVLVNGEIRGGLRDLLSELRKLDDADMIPAEADGRHISDLKIDVPLIRGRETKFSDTVVTVDSAISALRIAGLPELGGEEFSAPSATVKLFPDKSLRIESAGVMGGNPLRLVWQRGIDPDKPTPLHLNIAGSLSGPWLMARMGKVEGVTLQGNFTVAANLVEDLKGAWNFGVKATADRGRIDIEKLNFRKAIGQPLSLETQGAVERDGAIRLNNLKVNGKDADVAGSLSWNPAKPDETVAKFSPFRLGQNDVVVEYAGRQASVTGKRLDISGLDLFGSDGKDERNSIENVALNLDVQELVTEKGKLEQVKAQLTATKGRWDIRQLSAMVNGTSRVEARLMPITRQPGRRKLTLRIDDLGSTLSNLGMYDSLKGGRLTGDITYDAEDIGGGLLRIDDFQLKNPPTLMQILSLLSLEQLVAGTESTLFKQAIVPVRIDGDAVHIDNAALEGPSMSIRLNGTYNRAAEELNFDGKLAPGIPLNRLISKIPLLGTLLTGSQEGLVVADFKLKGPVNDTQVNVRPLSVITPGLVKDAWRGLTGPNETAPVPKVIDGKSK